MDRLGERAEPAARANGPERPWFIYNVRLKHEDAASNRVPPFVAYLMQFLAAGGGAGR